VEPIADPNFFTNVPDEYEDIVEDFFPSGHVCLIVGYFNIGKSPLVNELTIHIAHGLEWFNRKVIKRPVVVLDAESSEAQFKLNVQRICQRLGIEIPKVPDEYDALLLHGNPDNPATKRIYELLKTDNPVPFLRETLKRTPNAVIVVDPADCIFRVNTKDEEKMLKRYMDIKMILGEYREASIILILNLRKIDRSNKIPDLLKNPREWLMEVRGSMTQLDRSDTRIGIDNYKQDKEGIIKVVNGLIRGRDFYSMFIKPIQNLDDEYCGYSLCDPGEVQHTLGFTPAANNAWATLSPEFTWAEAKKCGITQGTLQRTIKHASKLGILKKGGNIYRKVYGPTTSGNNANSDTT